MSRVPITKKHSLVIWRDSVAAGDDIDAPHEIKLTVIGNESVADVIAKAVTGSARHGVALG